jgi:hypothetical protein
MDIHIEVSKSMDNTEGAIEFRTIKVPKDLRESAGLTLGDFLAVRRIDNGQWISLFIEKAFDDDAKANSLSAYVTSRIYPIIAKGGFCKVEPVNGITLGCDPELMVIDKNTGDLISAQYFLKLKKLGPVGYDGLLLEFRPLPSTDEAVVIDNIYNLIASARTSLNACKMFPNTMLAGISAFHGKTAVARNIKNNTALYQSNTSVTAGFHLHYGVPKAILGWQKNFVAQQVVKALDYYVGIPSIIPEGYGDSYRRTVQGLGYGKPGMFRLDHLTLEYRTPGAALMKHPILAQGLIGLGAVVIEDIVSRVKTITNGFTQLNEIANDADIRILYPNIPPVMEIFHAICSPTVDVAKSHLATIRKDVEKMVGFAARANSINNFFNNIETVFPYDVEENWWRYKNHGETQSG